MSAFGSDTDWALTPELIPQIKENAIESTEPGNGFRAPSAVGRGTIFEIGFGNTLTEIRGSLGMDWRKEMRRRIPNQISSIEVCKAIFLCRSPIISTQARARTRGAHGDTPRSLLPPRRCRLVLIPECADFRLAQDARIVCEADRKAPSDNARAGKNGPAAFLSGRQSFHCIRMRKGKQVLFQVRRYNPPVLFR